MDSRPQTADPAAVGAHNGAHNDLHKSGHKGGQATARHWRDWRRPAGQHPRSGWWSALGVALAAIGCAPAGPRLPASAVEALRCNRPADGPSGFPVSVLKAGDAQGPRVILVHGTPGSATGWTDYLAQPPAGMELVAIDRPGFGRSGPEGPLVGLAEQAHALLGLLPEAGRPVVLVGHSLGGPVVAWLAAQHPSRVHALVLLAASLDPDQEKTLMVQHLGGWGPVRALLPRAIRNANAELMALQLQLQALAPLLPRITAEVFIVHGSQDDLVPVANVPYLQARLSGARAVHTQVLEGRNHFLPWNEETLLRGVLERAAQAAQATRAGAAAQTVRAEAAVPATQHAQPAKPTDAAAASPRAAAGGVPC